MNKSFYSFEKTDVRGQKIVFLFSPQSLHGTSYEARQMAYNLRLCDVAGLDVQMLNTPPKPNSSNNVQNMQSSRHIAKPMLAAAAVKL